MRPHTLPRFPRRRPGPALLTAAGLLLAPPVPGQVVLNEILYHPPRDQDGLQFVEMANAGPRAVDMGGWSFVSGLRFVFPAGTRLEPGGFLVVVRNRSEFRERYGAEVPVAGQFEGRLSHGGERVALADAAGRVVDEVRYDDRAPWPLSADGGSASLERICPWAAGTDWANWAPARMPRVRAPVGTPGRTNDAYAPNLPPRVSGWTRQPADPAPGQAVTVTVRVADADGVGWVRLGWREVSDGVAGVEQTLPMRRRAGTAQDGVYEAVLPGRPEGRVVRYRVMATDGTGVERVEPSTNDLRTAWSYALWRNTNTARVPVAFLGQAREGEGGGRMRRGRLADALAPELARGEDTLVYLPAGGGPVQLFDFIQVTPRVAGRRVRLLKDQVLDGMTTVNVTMESARSAVEEVLAYELYERVGVPAPRAGHWRVTVNGRDLGWQLVFEQINENFLARRGRDDSGRLYKLLWYGRGVEGQHEKKTDLDGDHGDLLDVLEGLHAASDPAAQWTFIERHFNVTNFLNYYVVGMCLQNWDGFFNNYFTYHDTGGTGRWEIYPWDQDKTWGDHHGLREGESWYTMPLTYGMAGDRPPGMGPGGGGRGRGGTPSWWRGPGWFSGPLLANPEFRRRFLARLGEVCRTGFTPEVMGPRVDDLAARLEPEMADEAARAELRGYLQSVRDQLVHRRAFILTELARAGGNGAVP